MGNMRFKVGDRVRIKSLDWYKQMLSIPNKLVWQNKLTNDFVGIWCSSHIFKESMFGFLGKTMTIQEVGIDFYLMEEDTCGYEFNDEMIEGLVEETKYGTASNPIEPKSNANCLTLERVDALATKIDKEFPSGNQNVWELSDGYQFVDENGNVINATKIVLEKKKKEYPKTFEECVRVLEGENRMSLEQMNTFRKLIDARNAYWKIAGEEMGLGKPWEPDWNDGKLKWCMSYSGNYIEFDQYKSKHHTLAFPTEEMRDAFYENFKELIESCKELL